MMRLLLNVGKNLTLAKMLERELIPCLAKVKRSEFEIAFNASFHEIAGIINGWKQELLDERAPAGGGGEFTHHRSSLITLKKIDDGEFLVLTLRLFYSDLGWCSVIENGDYAAPGKFWGSDDGF